MSAAIIVSETAVLTVNGDNQQPRRQLETSWLDICPCRFGEVIYYSEMQQVLHAPKALVLVDRQQTHSQSFTTVHIGMTSICSIHLSLEFEIMHASLGVEIMSPIPSKMHTFHWRLQKHIRCHALRPRNPFQQKQPLLPLPDAAPVPLKDREFVVLRSCTSESSTWTDL